MSRIGAAFADGPAFVPYLAAGDPDAASSKRYVEALARGGADVIELGLPFSEPIAEGPTIQSAIVRALEAGMTPERYFAFVEDLDVDAPLVCMTYYNLVYQYGTDAGAGPAADPGPERFVERAARAGIDGFVIPDLPAEESNAMRAACDAHGLDLVFVAAPTTEGDRLRRIVEQVSGFLYVQARLGVTGARDDLSEYTERGLERVAAVEAELGRTVPKAVGFGISTGEHAERVVAAGADGVIVGSALVEIVADGAAAGDDAETVARRLEDAAKELKAGARRGADEDVPHPERT